MKKDKEYYKERLRFLEEVQAHIVVAGGIKIHIDKLAHMEVNDLLNFTYPNGIRFNVYATIIQGSK